MKKLRQILSMFLKDWNDDNLADHAAALSYYALFSLAPLLILLISLTNTFLHDPSIQNNTIIYLRRLMGDQGGNFVSSLLQTSKTASGLIPTLFGLVILISGAVGFLSHLQETLVIIFDIKITKKTFVSGIKDQLLAFTIIIILALLIIGSSLLNGFFSSVSSVLGFHPLAHMISMVISFTLPIFLFAFIFKILPSARYSWKTTSMGGLITTLLFTFGRILLGYYLKLSALSSTYGAASSLVAFLLWIYYTSLIIFIGAEFTKYISQKYISNQS